MVTTAAVASADEAVWAHFDCVVCPPASSCVRRASAADDVDDPNAEPVDALTMGRMMALVAQQGGDLDVALEQVRARPLSGSLLFADWYHSCGTS